MFFDMDKVYLYIFVPKIWNTLGFLTIKMRVHFRNPKNASFSFPQYVKASSFVFGPLFFWGPCSGFCHELIVVTKKNLVFW